MSSSSPSSSSSSLPKRAAIIGAGVSGITTAKCCLEEGIEVIVYEQSKNIGGLWRFEEGEGSNGRATVMHSTVINSGKEVSAYSDFPPPAKYPNFMHNSQMMQYIDSYAQSFNFSNHVRLEHEVLSVTPSATHETNGSWLILVKDHATGLEHQEVFDAVYICTGHHGTKRMPAALPGQETFKGTIQHAHEVKSGEKYRGKRVLIVGLGNSGADLAAEMGPIAKQTYISIKHGTWVAHRVGPLGIPMDHYFLRRIIQMLIDILPISIISSILEMIFNLRFDHARYCLQPQTHALGQHITINDALPNLIISGRVEIRGRMVRFEEDAVVFEDGQRVEVDAVIFATGYQMFTFPFLNRSLIKPESNRIPLYKYIFPPYLSHPHTLAFIGLIQPLGPIMNASEIQARWVVKLLTEPKKYKLPPQEVMLKDIETKKAKNGKRFYDSVRHAISFDWMPYMDEIAKEIGCEPQLLTYFFTDFWLWLKLVFGCAGAYQYRLNGPGAWSKARETIMSLEARIEAPFKTREIEKLEKSKTKSFIWNLVILLFVLKEAVFIYGTWMLVKMVGKSIL